MEPEESGNTSEREVKTTKELLEDCERLVEENKLGQAHLILDAICKSNQEAGRDVHQQRLVLQIIINGRSKEYAKVLGVEGKPDIRAITSSYRKLAQQIHPDKCKCFGAAEAFQLLNNAAQSLQASEEGGFVKGKDDQHAWWDKWEGDNSSAKRKRKWEGEQTTEGDAELLNLRQCPIEELKNIVASRQKAVLRPEKSSAEAKMTAAQRQTRVRTARGILNERLANVKNAGKKPGGFI